MQKNKRTRSKNAPFLGGVVSLCVPKGKGYGQGFAKLKQAEPL